MEETAAEVAEKNHETPAQHLNLLKQMRFLFHGSSNNQIEILEPRPTYDPNTPQNTDTAVFATDNLERFMFYQKINLMNKMEHNTKAINQ